MTIERDLTGQLFEATIRHNFRIGNSWVTTMEHCLELAPCRNVEGHTRMVWSDKQKRHIFISDIESDVLVVNRQKTMQRASDAIIDQGIAADFKKAKAKARASTARASSSKKRKGKKKL